MSEHGDWCEERAALEGARRAWDEVWSALDRIASSRITLPSRGDGFIEGYEAGLREARGIALAAMADAYRAFGENPDTLPNGMLRLGGANVRVAQAIGSALRRAALHPEGEPE